MTEKDIPDKFKEHAKRQIETRIAKVEIVNGKFIFHSIQPASLPGQMSFSAYMGYDGMNLFRCVSAGEGFSKLKGILENGCDGRYKSAGTLVDLAITLEHSLEYGGAGANITYNGGPDAASRIVMIYKLRDSFVHPSDAQDLHQYRFLVPPKEALLGVILLYSEKDKEKGLIKVN